MKKAPARQTYSTKPEDMPCRDAPSRCFRYTVGYEGGRAFSASLGSPLVGEQPVTRPPSRYLARSLSWLG